MSGRALAKSRDTRLWILVFRGISFKCNEELSGSVVVGRASASFTEKRFCVLLSRGSSFKAVVERRGAAVDGAFCL